MTGNRRPKVFIVGSSRSGTSAFTRLLGRHGQIALGMERYVSLVSKMPVAEWPDSLFDKQQFFDFKTDSANRAYYKEQEPKFDTAEWLGDKVPSWIQHVPELRARYPNCVFFCMLREPSDVGFSFASKAARATKGYWYGKTFGTGVLSAVRSFDRAEEYLRSGMTGFHMIEYDRLFPHDPAYLTAVLHRLNLEPDERILSYYADASRSTSEMVQQKPREIDAKKIDFLERRVDRQQIDFLRAHSVLV